MGRPKPASELCGSAVGWTEWTICTKWTERTKRGTKRMKHLDLTLASAEENLALDETLLDLCDRGNNCEILRFWEPAIPFVVIGYANRAAAEVDLESCRATRIPVLRRCTGGGTVLQGPGCLNYTLILRISHSTALQTISGTNNFILQRNRSALMDLLPSQVEIRGHTDLAIGGRKFSGNSQRRRKNCLLFHGTFLLDFDVSLVEKTLRFPSRQPEYRAGRSHGDFLTNLEIPAHNVKAALITAWGAFEPLTQIALDQVQDLVREKYSRDEWNSKF